MTRLLWSWELTIPSNLFLKSIFTDKLSCDCIVLLSLTVVMLFLFTGY